jgi:hypothetical protein
MVQLIKSFLLMQTLRHPYAILRERPKRFHAAGTESFGAGVENGVRMLVEPSLFHRE